ncbi:MAG: hypothetical protein HQL91_07195 [Magnetococcales bacterium]|nr:hypothetical protein [Magnetococcales bacterium]
MTLLEELNKLKSQWHRLPFSLPEISLTERLLANIETKPMLPPKPPVDLKAVHRKLVEANSNGSWSTIEPVEWRYASECLVMGQPPLLHDDSFVSAYLAAMRSFTSGGAIRRLARFYLVHFDRKVPGINRIASYLRENLGDCGIWAARHAQYQLFMPERAPESLSSAVQAQSDNPRRFLESIGFSGNLAGSGLTAEAFLLSCRTLQRQIENTDSGMDALSIQNMIEPIWNWATNDGKTFSCAGHRLAQAAFADALLLPWVNRAPPDDLQEFISSKLLSLFKDPRMRPSTWVSVQPEAKRVFFRWLTKASLEQFLGFVDIIVDPKHKAMWEARRRFWRAYHDQHFMQEAWVVFGNKGAWFAAKTANRGHSIGFSTFQSGSGSGSDPTQCVLIMRIGSLVVADWSHNGACHIWHESRPMAPKLYDPTYGRDALRSGSDFRQTHQGNWQREIANYIRAETNARPTRYL